MTSIWLKKIALGEMLFSKIYVIKAVASYLYSNVRHFKARFRLKSVISGNIREMEIYS